MTDIYAEFPAVDGTFEPDHFCGVYLLMLGADVVYVGQSNNIWVRIYNHRNGRTRPECEAAIIKFDQIKFIKISGADERRETEQELIRQFNPPHNVLSKTKPRTEHDDAEGDEFFKWLHATFLRKGARLPPRPTYKDFYVALDSLLARLPIREG